MKQKHSIYVEILPDGEWPNWSDCPWRSKLGRITKKTPRDGRRYARIDIEVENQDAFGTPLGVEASTS